MSEDQVYEEFIAIMFDNFDSDELAYAHVVQQQAIWDERDY